MRWTTAASIGLATLSLASSLAVVVLSLAMGQDGAQILLGQTGFAALFGVTFSLIGAFVARRLPRNPVGWMLLGIGLCEVFSVLGSQYMAAATENDLPRFPGVALVAEVSWILAVPLLSGLLLYFPHGRLPSPRWRPVVWSALLGVILVQVGVGLAWETRTQYLVHDEVPIPPPAEMVWSAGAVLFLLGWIVALVGLVFRFRSSSGDERQQLKWFVYAAVVVFVGFVASSNLGEVGNLITLALVPLLPVAIAIAILRYRLYDIDLVINRTLVYLALTGFLALVYFGGIVGLSQLLPFTDNDLAVAASTLAAAALFTPARRHIQSFVDRRFYRQRYDRQKLVEEMSARFRERADLDVLAAELDQITLRALAPAAVGLWLREAEAGRQEAQGWR